MEENTIQQHYGHARIIDPSILSSIVRKKKNDHYGYGRKNV